MNRSAFLGNILVNSGTIFDGHLIFLLIPIVVLLIVANSNVNKWTKTLKQRFFKISSILLFAFSSLSFIEFLNFNQFDKAMESFMFFNNLDIVAVFLLSIALFTNRFSMARALVPCIIVLGATRLINNPGASISTVEAITDIAGMSVALAILPIFRKAISVRENLVVTLITFALIAQVFVLNKFLSTSYTTFNLSEIKENPIYKWMPGDAFVMISFLLVFLLAQTFVWFVIRLTFRVSSKLNSETFVESITHEWNDTKRFANIQLTKLQQLSTVKKDILEIEEICDSISDQDQESEKESNVALQKETWEPVADVLPLQLEIVKTSHGIRAPSL